MRVCDITRTDPVTAQGRISFGRIDSEDDWDSVELDLGKAAFEALVAQDWAALAKLVPAGLRKKDESRSTAAKKAAVTRKANKAQKQAEAAPNGPQQSQTEVATHNALAAFTALEDRVVAANEASEADDPDAWLKD